jgi:hypothetical protein
MRRVNYIPNSVQDTAIIEVVSLIVSKLRKAEGGWIRLHGEARSWVTTVLYRLCQGQRFEAQHPWLVIMTPMSHLMGVRETLLHAMRLPNDSDAWPNTTVVPSFLAKYLTCSKNKIVLVDDFHIVEKLSKLERLRFLNIIQVLVKPPYSLLFVLAGNFGRFQPAKRDWSDFTMSPLVSIRKFKPQRELQEFSNSLLSSFVLDMNLSCRLPMVSLKDAKHIVDLTKGYVGEIVSFLSILARECQSGSNQSVPGRDAFNIACGRYRVRHG